MVANRIKLPRKPSVTKLRFVGKLKTKLIKNPFRFNFGAGTSVIFPDEMVEIDEDTCSVCLVKDNVEGETWYVCKCGFCAHKGCLKKEYKEEEDFVCRHCLDTLFAEKVKA